MKKYKLYVGIVLSIGLLLLGGCDTESNTPAQSKISNTNTSSQMGVINTHTTVFENITKKLTDNGGTLNGKVDIVGLDKIPAIYFEMVDNIEIEVDFSLVRNKGDLVIVYISPDERETIIVDTSELDGDAVDHTVILTLEKGFGEIEFRGDNTRYEFALTFPQLNPDNVSYFDIVPYNEAPTTVAASPMLMQMELTNNYDTSDPFIDERLFYVDENIKVLELDISFQMEGESGILEIADNRTKQIIWCDTWNGDVGETKFTASLDTIEKGKEYVVRFTGTKIKYANIVITSEDNLAKERERPLKSHRG